MKLTAFLLPDPARMLPIGILVVRVATGLVMVPHGLNKLLGATHPLAETLHQKGLPAALALAYCAALAELFGGLLTAIGLFTRFAAASVAFTMSVAWIAMHTGSIAQIGTGKGAVFEYPFYVSLVALAVVVAGPGPLSLDAKLFGKR